MQMSQAKILEANEGLKIPEEHCNTKIDYKLKIKIRKRQTVK